MARIRRLTSLKSSKRLLFILAPMLWFRPPSCHRAGADEDWDCSCIHDPFPLIYNGRIYLYYKGSPASGGEERTSFARRA